MKESVFLFQYKKAKFVWHFWKVVLPNSKKVYNKLTKYAKKVLSLGILALIWSTTILAASFNHTSRWVWTVWQSWFSNRLNRKVTFDLLCLKILQALCIVNKNWICNNKLHYFQRDINIIEQLYWNMEIWFLSFQIFSKKLAKLVSIIWRMIL